MPETKLTLNTDERQIRKLLDKNTVYQVPLFQRPYRWMPAKLQKFQKDLLATLDVHDALHFLGAIIIHRVDSNFPDVDTYEIIDGQQRITTVYLHLAAAANVLASTAAGVDGALRILFTYLINNEFNLGKPASLKLQPSREDREPINNVIRRLVNGNGLNDHMKDKTVGYLQQLAPRPSPRIQKNYDMAVRFFRDQQRDGGDSRIQDLVDTMLGQLSVVVISVIDPLSGPKIYDSLNSAQEAMTVGDLVRNDIYARAAGSLTSIDDIEVNHWKPFFEGFGDPANGRFEDYFFPYGLIDNPNVKKSDVYQRLRDSWATRGLSAIPVIDELGRYQADYLMIRDGRAIDDHPPSVQRAFRRFFLMRSTTALLPFTMRLSCEIRLGEFDPAACVDILSVLDSFLTRRAVLGQEPTGLHAVFRGLWQNASKAGGVTAATVSEAISSAKTVQWPTDAEFSAAIKQRPLYGVSVTPYVLLELDRSLGGDSDDRLDFWIEHVLPQSSTSMWPLFSAEDRKLYSDTLANLLPLSQGMNQALSNGPYQAKRPVFREDSKYKMTRRFAEEYSEWSPSVLKQRADALADAATRRWPHSRVST